MVFVSLVISTVLISVPASVSVRYVNTRRGAKFKYGFVIWATKLPAPGKVGISLAAAGDKSVRRADSSDWQLCTRAIIPTPRQIETVRRDRFCMIKPPVPRGYNYRGWITNLVSVPD